MQVILVKDMDNLGSAHEVVNVRPGYARNYLIPLKLAIEASSSNLKIVVERNKVKDKKEAALLSEINKVSDVLKASPIKIGAKQVLQVKYLVRLHRFKLLEPLENKRVTRSTASEFLSLMK